MEYYIASLVVMGCLNGILVLGFNLQFGHAGILNFAFIVLVAVGAYTTGIAGVGPAPHDGYTFYIGGFGWSFPWTVLFGVGCTLAFGIVLGFSTLLRLRFDYLALTLFAVATGLQVLITDDVRIFNGAYGINSIPGPGGPAASQFGFQATFMMITFLALCAVFALLLRLDRSPLGRALRAVREDEGAAASVGKRVLVLKLTAFMLGAGIAGLGGALLATYVGGWNPQSWLPTETIGLLAATIVGGRGRYLGAFVGSIVVLEVITEASRYLPQIGNADVLPAIQAGLIGAVLLVFLWWLPQGILPERKERFGTTGAGMTAVLARSIIGTGRSSAEPRHLQSTEVPESMIPAVGVSGLSCAFEGVRAVDEVSLSVRRGSFVGIIGPNGAGKSTLLDCISGVNTSYTGAVRFDGRDVTKWPAYRLSRLGMIRTFQVSRLFMHMTVLSNLMAAPYPQEGERLVRALGGGWRRKEAELLSQAWELLGVFRLERVADSYCSELSGGQQRLVELCRAMMCQPTVLLLDEPYAGVSPANRKSLSDALEYLWRDRGVTIVMIEHRLELVEALCESVIVMAGGRVLTEGTLEQVKADRYVMDAYLGRSA